MGINGGTSFGSVATARNTKARALCLGLCALGIALAASAGTPNMQFITFDVPPVGKLPGAGTGFLQGTGCFWNLFRSYDCSVILDESGAITGYYVDQNYVGHGFVRSPDGTITTFDEPEANTSAYSFAGTFPTGINDAGAIAGEYVDSGGLQHGFLRSPDGRFTTLDPAGSSLTSVNGLNLEGAVVGWDVNEIGGVQVVQSYLRYPDGSFETWTGPGQCETSPSTNTNPLCYGGAALGINVFGTVAGLYEDEQGVLHGLVRGLEGNLTSYDVPGAATAPVEVAPGVYYPEGTGCPACSSPINLWGAIAGSYTDSSSVAHGYLRSPGGSTTTFDLPGPGCPSDCSVGLNNFGAITGYYSDANQIFHGFLRTAAGKWISFDAPGAGTTTPGCFVSFFCEGTFPVSINDAGVIAGYYVDANGTSHGFLLLAPEGGW